MRKFFAFQISLLLLFVGSCSEQKSKHLILGKWESKTTPKLSLIFEENNSLMGEFLVPNGHLYKYGYRFSVLDEKSVSFIDNSVGPKVTIEAKIVRDTMHLGCSYKKIPNEPDLIDYPELCNYAELIRVK